MSRRTDLFNSTNIKSIHLNNPYMKIFLKTDWQEYLEILACIYDVLEEENSKVDSARVEGVLRNFYAKKPLVSIEGKMASFLSMSIGELEVLKDFHDSRGRRLFSVTLGGKRLLKMCEGLIINRKSYTGQGADTLLGNLNNMLFVEKKIPLNEALDHHKSKILDYKKDISRMKAQGVNTSLLLPSQISMEELFTSADEAASTILSAGEDIKLAIEQARRKLLSRYTEKNVSIGQTIEYYVDFHHELNQTPEYLSFSRAKDLLSYIQGIGGDYALKDVGHIINMAIEKNLISRQEVDSSSLKNFMRHFQNIINAIDEKIAEQINLLKVQVDYVVSGNTKKVREELNELMALFHQESSNVQKLFEKNPFSIMQEGHIDFGKVISHDFQSEMEVTVDAFTPNTVSDSEHRALMLALSEAEEATIKKVLIRLKGSLARKKEIQLSAYEIIHGLVEYYVLSKIEYFGAEFGSETVGVTNIFFNKKRHQESYVLRNVDDKRIFYV